MSGKSGWKQSVEAKSKMRESKLGEKNPMFGKKPHNFKGTHQLYWKKQAKRRDKYTCRECGLYAPDIVEVDHIIPQRVSPRLKAVLSNLVTLCPNCHSRKTKADKKKYANLSNVHRGDC